MKMGVSKGWQLRGDFPYSFLPSIQRTFSLPPSISILPTKVLSTSKSSTTCDELTLGRNNNRRT